IDIDHLDVRHGFPDLFMRCCGHRCLSTISTFCLSNMRPDAPYDKVIPSWNERANMRICRFDHAKDRDRLGVAQGDKIFDVSAALEVLEPLRWPMPMGDRMIANLETLRPRMEALIKGNAPSFPLASVKLKAPIANPNKFFCGAANWPEHVKA